jgi:hypothetical protein
MESWLSGQLTKSGKLFELSESAMRKFIQEFLYDARFIKDHELQPAWYKIFKVFLLLGLMIGFTVIFGWSKTLIFFLCFFSLSLVVHLIYRHNTKKFTQSWLDFVVEEVDGQSIPNRIGIYYYLAVIINGIISFLVSQFV